jgi:cysteine desulfurase / selenocysteine lyase
MIFNKIEDDPNLIEAIRNRFAHVDECPFQGPRIFFENAGGALTLKSVVETSATYAAIPDNQGRDNPASKALMAVIAKARGDLAEMMNAPEGQFFVGESGTELLFRMIRTACLNAPKGSNVVGSSLEHPASRSAARRWAGIAGLDYVNVPHDDQTGTVTVDHYLPHIDGQTAVATIVHTSPVTGMGVDVAQIAAAIRAVAPDCLIIVDGIQHAAHGRIDIVAYGVDGYAISPYKMFSRHGFGVAWISDRLSALPHDQLDGASASGWELGTRDTGAYATMSDVVDYFDWLGAQVSPETDRRARLVAAGRAIHGYERYLSDAMIFGIGNQSGLADMHNVTILGGADNPGREGLVSIAVAGVESAEVVARLNHQGIRTHLRKADHYSGNILAPLGLNSCIRVSLCHYNTGSEVARFLTALRDMAG